MINSNNGVKKITEEIKLKSGMVKEWKKPYAHDVLELEVRTKEEHEAVIKILKMNPHGWRIALDEFEKDDKRSPQLWSPKTFELIFKAFNTRAGQLNAISERNVRINKALDTFIDTTSRMREQRTYANMNEEVERRKTLRIRSGDDYFDRK